MPIKRQYGGISGVQNIVDLLKKLSQGNQDTVDPAGDVNGVPSTFNIENILGQLNTGLTDNGFKDGIGGLLSSILNPSRSSVDRSGILTNSQGFLGFRQRGGSSAQEPFRAETLSPDALSLSPVNAFLSNISGRDPVDLAQLALETRRHESGANFNTKKEFQTKQLKDGPARGAFQIEPKSMPTLARKLNKIYELSGIEPPAEFADVRSGKISDATKLSPQLQEDLFYAGFTQFDDDGSFGPTRSLKSINPNSLNNRAQLWLNVHNKSEGGGTRKQRKDKFLKDNQGRSDFSRRRPPRAKSGGKTNNMKRRFNYQYGGRVSKIDDALDDKDSKKGKKKLRRYLKKQEKQINEIREQIVEDTYDAKLEQSKQIFNAQYGDTGLSAEAITPRSGLQLFKKGGKVKKKKKGKKYQLGGAGLLGSNQIPQQTAVAPDAIGLNNSAGNFLMPGVPQTFSPLLPSGSQLQALAQQEQLNQILQSIGETPVAQLGGLSSQAKSNSEFIKFKSDLNDLLANDDEESTRTRGYAALSSLERQFLGTEDQELFKVWKSQGKKGLRDNLDFEGAANLRNSGESKSISSGLSLIGLGLKDAIGDATGIRFQLGGLSAGVQPEITESIEDLQPELAGIPVDPNGLLTNDGPVIIPSRDITFKPGGLPLDEVTIVTPIPGVDAVVETPIAAISINRGEDKESRSKGSRRRRKPTNRKKRKKRLDDIHQPINDGRKC